jgi:hypothetical protein
MVQRRTKGRSRATRPDGVPETTRPSAAPTTGPSAVPKTTGPSRKGWQVLLAAKGWQVLIAAVVSGICFVLGSYLKTADTSPNIRRRALKGGRDRRGQHAVPCYDIDR